MVGYDGRLELTRKAVDICLEWCGACDATGADHGAAAVAANAAWTAEDWMGLGALTIPVQGMGTRVNSSYWARRRGREHHISYMCWLS